MNRRIIKQQQDKQRRQSCSLATMTAHFLGDGLNGNKDNETLKRTVRALEDLLESRNLRAQTTQADLYSRWKSGVNITDDNDEEYKKNDDISENTNIILHLRRYRLNDPLPRRLFAVMVKKKWLK